MDECHTWYNGSVWHKDWSHKIYIGQWPIFHGPVILPYILKTIWAPSSEFVSSSIPSRQVLIVHAQPFREARDLAFCLKVPLDSLLIWVSSGGSGETAWMRRLAWTFAVRIGDEYHIRLTQSIWWMKVTLDIMDQCDTKIDHIKYISWSSNFALYLKDYLMDEGHTWFNRSVWHKDWPH